MGSFWGPLPVRLLCLGFGLCGFCDGGLNRTGFGVPDGRLRPHTDLLPPLRRRDQRDCRGPRGRPVRPSVLRGYTQLHLLRVVGDAEPGVGFEPQLAEMGLIRYRWAFAGMGVCRPSDCEADDSVMVTSLGCVLVGGDSPRFVYASAPARRRRVGAEAGGFRGWLARRGSRRGGRLGRCRDRRRSARSCCCHPAHRACRRGLRWGGPSRGRWGQWTSHHRSC